MLRHTQLAPKDLHEFVQSEPWREGGGCMMYMMVDDDDLNDESFQCFDIFLSSLSQIIAQSPGQSKADDLQSAAILSKVSLRTLQC